MGWENRLRAAAYFPPESPNLALEFQYENVSRETEKRTAGFEFPGVDGAYVQDNGFGAEKYPMRCFFSGPDHDIEATVFELALLQRGPGRLRHPLYGEFDAIPVGSIGRRDDLATRANQSVVTVTFWTTTRLVYPASKLDASSSLEASINAFIVDSAPAQFADAVDVQSEISRGSLKRTTQNMLAEVERALGKASSATESVNRQFRDAIDAVNLSLDILVGQPLQLAQQVANLISLPARAVTGFTDRVTGYVTFARAIFGSEAGRPYERVGQAFSRSSATIANDFLMSDLGAASAINAALLAALESKFTTRTGAQMAAVSLLSLFDEFVAWREPGYASVAIDTGEVYESLQASVALAAGFLIEVSFSLLAERVMVLQRNRTLVDLSAELYGSVSNDRLNSLINTNDLTGSQILELQRGDRIVWYA